LFLSVKFNSQVGALTLLVNEALKAVLLSGQAPEAVGRELVAF
jgi:hypothetical protein